MIGAVVGGALMTGALGAAGLDQPQMRGYVAEKFSVEALRKVRGWTVVDSVAFEHSDVDHVVVTPSAVLAVETKHHQSDLPRTSRAAHERAHRDLACARTAAAKTRSLLRSAGFAHIPVTPVLMIWGPGAPDIADGSRDVVCASECGANCVVVPRRCSASEPIGRGCARHNDTATERDRALVISRALYGVLG